MTVDMLAATFFWPEGTFLHLREEVETDIESGDPLPSTQTGGPLIHTRAETFWTALLRQIGWPLPPKPQPS